MRAGINKFFRSFFLINDTPHKVAAGAALGVFLGILPGEGLLATIILSSLFRFNRLAATAGVLAVNMWSTVLILPLAAMTGGTIFGVSPNSLTQSFHQSYQLGWQSFVTRIFLLDIALPLLVGFFLVTGAIALISYLAIRIILKHYKPQNSEHLLENSI